LISRYTAHASLIAGQSGDILHWLRSVQSQPAVAAITDREDAEM
jgi:hypothetical protein